MNDGRGKRYECIFYSVIACTLRTNEILDIMLSLLLLYSSGAKTFLLPP